MGYMLYTTPDFPEYFFELQQEGKIDYIRDQCMFYKLYSMQIELDQPASNHRGRKNCNKISHNMISGHNGAIIAPGFD